MRPATRLLFALALSAGAPGFAAAQKEFEGVVTTRMEMGGMMTFDVVTWSKPGKMRQEMSMMGQDMISIIDANAGTSITLLPAQKAYMKMDWKALAEQARAQQGGKEPEMKLTATGTSETILGHRCENYVMEVGDARMQVCVATGLGFYTGGMNAQAGANMDAGMQARHAELRERFRDGFFPLRTTMSSQGVAMTMEVTKIEPKPVPDDRFSLEVPAGYTEIRGPAGL